MLRSPSQSVDPLACSRHERQIHFNKPSAPEEDPKQVTKALKLMHRFDPEDIEAKMDEIEKAPAS